MNIFLRGCKKKTLKNECNEVLCLSVLGLLYWCYQKRAQLVEHRSLRKEEGEDLAQVETLVRVLQSVLDNFSRVSWGVGAGGVGSAFVTVQFIHHPLFICNQMKPFPQASVKTGRQEEIIRTASVETKVGVICKGSRHSALAGK